MELYSELLGVTEETARLAGRIPGDHSFAICKIFKAYWEEVYKGSEAQHDVFNRWASSQDGDGLLFISSLNACPCMEEAVITDPQMTYARYLEMRGSCAPKIVVAPDARRKEYVFPDDWYWMRLHPSEIDVESLRLGYYINPFREPYIIRDDKDMPQVFIDYDKIKREVWVIRGKVQGNWSRVEEFFRRKQPKLIDMLTLLGDQIFVARLQKASGEAFPDIMSIPVIDDGIKLTPPKKNEVLRIVS
jgi:hypothetical protein